MSKGRLTRDNPLLSRPILGPLADLSVPPGAATNATTPLCEINFTTELPDDVAGYVEKSLSENTRRAYAADLAHFQAWGGSIPATDMTIAKYLAEHADTLSVATLCRRLATITKAHAAEGFASPTRSELVKATIRGIKRSRGTAQVEAKPLLRDDLFAVLERMGDDPKSTRDRALLLIGFAGGFRRSELVGLDVEDIEQVRQGIIIQLRRSKTDQEGVGRKIGIPFGRTRCCPVNALDQWLSTATIGAGPIFRCVSRHGHISEQRLSAEAVALVLKGRLLAADVSPDGFSAHSLRAGLVTSAAMVGVSPWKIRQQTGHASDAMLGRYIRDIDLFISNAAGAIL
ncbi:MAG: integrase [Mesorhizobium sp.]|uniref:site-specific integrase n=1 Tax=unclassified Mesorhizobium TaxID=325217 RepID=UPI000F74DE2B|nr:MULTISPECIES: site-specific integrase [unclassified Mesorhizobium]AZO72162.1 integrase [Mesorhizobium sp. M1D.F.Ca.ET.043.01.1.1]RWA94945.1 MAG: integrase [Mesorhizobium sp.]RWE17656.1 MAG: integrase [Mesorhizobium sp.]TJW89851.1 MAG: integrase [Mesorhizobium sp.]